MSWHAVDRGELRLAGVPLRVSPLFLVLAALAGWHYHQYVATTELADPVPPMPRDPAKVLAWLDRYGVPSLSYPSSGWALAAGVGVALVWCLSVLAHELGHLFAARALKLKVVAIELHFAGGFVEIDDDRLTAGKLAAIAGAGPLVTAALAFVGWAACRAVPDPRTGAAVAGEAVLSFLLLMNAGALALNLLPLRSLDGGRLLSAARLWVRRQGWATR